MNACPACSQWMTSFELEGVEIDRCLECSGTWLDAGELEMLTELSGASPGTLSRALRAAAPLRRDRRRCPRCRRRMQVIDVGGDPRIELDRCPMGHGLWFDRGETEAVIASFGDGDAGAASDFFSELYRSKRG